MGSDLVLSMKDASANETTLFGLNHHAAPGQRHQVHRVLGHQHDLGEILHTGALELHQVRQTYSVLGVQPAGQWGFTHGVNEHRVVIGVTHWQSRLAGESPTLSGAELVRLGLERSKSAHHAVEVLTDLIGRHGQGPTEGDRPPRHDHIFLIADRDEAYVLEASGHYWALLECHHTRVVTDAAMIRQDWRKLAPGLADFVEQQGWWLDDGSKIDFVRCLGENTDKARNAQRRWGRASVALAQQQGAIDLHFLRRMLAEHYENCANLLPVSPEMRLADSFLVDLGKSEQPVLAWASFGTPDASVYFPLCLAGELPTAWTGEHPDTPTIEDLTHELEKLTRGSPKHPNDLILGLERLQIRFDQDAEEFLIKAHDCLLQGNTILLSQLATEMMHNHVELFEKEYRILFHVKERFPQPAAKPEELLFFA